MTRFFHDKASISRERPHNNLKQKTRRTDQSRFVLRVSSIAFQKPCTRWSKIGAFDRLEASAKSQNPCSTTVFSIQGLHRGDKKGAKFIKFHHNSFHLYPRKLLDFHSSFISSCFVLPCAFDIKSDIRRNGTGTSMRTLYLVKAAFGIGNSVP